MNPTPQLAPLCPAQPSTPLAHCPTFATHAGVSPCDQCEFAYKRGSPKPAANRLGLQKCRGIETPFTSSQMKWERAKKVLSEWGKPLALEALKGLVKAAVLYLVAHYL
jgi:hypothetical protein